MSKISEFFTPDMMMAVGFFIVGHALGWFAGNAQFVWEFWKDKPVLATVLMGTPAGLCFWYGTKYCMAAGALQISRGVYENNKKTITSANQ